MSSTIKAVLVGIVVVFIAGSYVFMDAPEPRKPQAPPPDPNSPPQLVDMEPPNNSIDVDPDLTEIRVTFNMPMGGGMSWCGGGPKFPTIPEGQRPFWTEDKKTCVMPVTLKRGRSYAMGINCPAANNFRNANGIPAAVTWYDFSTRK